MTNLVRRFVYKNYHTIIFRDFARHLINGKVVTTQDTHRGLEHIYEHVYIVYTHFINIIKNVSDVRRSVVEPRHNQYTYIVETNNVVYLLGRPTYQLVNNGNLNFQKFL